MKFKAMRTFVMAFCILAIATGGVGCKRDKDGKGAKVNRTPRVKRGGDQKGDRVKKGQKPDRGSRREQQALRDKLADKTKRNKRGSEPPTTVGGMGQAPKRPPAGSRPVPRVHRKWEERQYTADAVAQAKALAQPGLGEAVTHVGREGRQLLVTYRYAGEDESQVVLVMVNVTAANEGSLKGTVVRKSPAGADVPLGEGDSLTVAQADVVDWTLQVGDKAHGHFLGQASLEAAIEAGADEDGKSAARLAELRADLPE
ncbi:MAG: hypothetical protein IH988_00350 [Planctomycetes bacterium]|nr:hypothetical protein [Planctomycetota bacterium]